MEIVKHAIYCNDAFYLKGMLAATFHADSNPNIIGLIKRIRAIGDPPDKAKTLIQLELADGTSLVASAKEILPLYRLSLTAPLTLPDNWGYYGLPSKYWIFVVGQEVVLHRDRFISLTGHDKPTTGGWVVGFNAWGGIYVATHAWLGKTLTPILIKLRTASMQIRPTASGSRIWIEFSK